MRCLHAHISPSVRVLQVSATGAVTSAIGGFAVTAGGLTVAAGGMTIVGGTAVSGVTAVTSGAASITSSSVSTVDGLSVYASSAGVTGNVITGRSAPGATSANLLTLLQGTTLLFQVRE